MLNYDYELILIHVGGLNIILDNYNKHSIKLIKQLGNICLTYIKELITTLKKNLIVYLKIEPKADYSFLVSKIIINRKICFT